jgi:putative membrane protein
MKNKKMISGLLLFTITSYMTIPVFAASKSETVYSNLDSNGKAYKTIVSTQLTNEDKSDEITDISNLLNIENTNGDETFKKEGNQIVWDSNGNNIYYKGESDKQLPVECKITYELNGEEISAEELKGKSGNVKIKINYTNNEKHIVSINGKQVTMYTPFIIVAGTKIDNAKNKNIQITNGKIVDNGESTLAVGIAMPGMQENIGISKSKIDIPEEIEISMETEDFEMGNIIAVVAVKGIDEDLTSDLNSMYSQINELANASNEILAGANQLKEGTSELVSGVDQLKDGTGAAYAGSKQIKDEVEESTKNLKNDNTPAIDSKTLEAIKAQAMQSATLSDEQKAGIAAQAKAAATLSDEQKAGIAAQAKTGAKLTDAQKAGIAAQAKAAAKLTDAQKAEIAAQAKLTDEQKAKITAQAKAGAEFTETQKTAIIEQAQKKYTETLTEAEKQLILTVAQNTAYQTATTTALAVAESTAEATALKVAQSVAESTAEATALKVAQSVAESTAEATAQTVAQSTATQTAETTALTVAQSTATQTAGATATQTATQVGNQAKQKFTNQVVSQMSTLGTALDELTNGLANIDNGVSALSVGTNKLDSGALQLANGVKTFNEQGISKINNLVNGDLRNIASRVEKMNELANEYNNYAGIQNGMAGEVKFIMITDSTTGNGEVKKEEAVITTEAKDSKEIKENKEE